MSLSTSLDAGCISDRFTSNHTAGDLTMTLNKIPPCKTKDGQHQWMDMAKQGWAKYFYSIRGGGYRTFKCAICGTEKERYMLDGKYTDGQP
eukprot:g36525.t1